MSRIAIVHRVSIPEPWTHLVQVETVLSAPSGLPGAIVLAMPVWTPGSYLVREYARHVEGLVAVGSARAFKIRKNAWRVDTQGGPTAIIRYRVYAAELTVRTSHVDDTHAFLVGAGIFFEVEGHDGPSRVEIAVPREWRAVTALPVANPPHGGDDAGARLDGASATITYAFDAPDFDTLIDSPIELGVVREDRFEVLRKPHRYAIWPAGAVTDADMTRLATDTKKILETEASLFGGALPYDAYDILLHLSPQGRGGLEHRESAALVAPPSSFATRDGYVDLLSLVAHEALHAWNVKRIRPAGLTPYRYGEECYTRLLWWFEGATSYYDWRVLQLARLCQVEEYLEHLAGEIAYLDQTPGRLVHSLEEASYDAWIKLYRPDENSRNSSVSYYRKGEMVCAMLDLEIRARTEGRATLDRVLAHLWQEHGAPERPVPEDGMQALFERVAGVPLGDLFDAWIRGAVEIDYARVLAHVGLVVERSARPDSPGASLGARVRSDGGRAVVDAVTRGSAAWRGGIDPGDEVVAIGGVRIEGANVEGVLRGRAANEDVDVVVARRNRLVTRRVRLDPARTDRVKIVANRQATSAARAAFAAWLGVDHPAWAGTNPDVQAP